MYVGCDVARMKEEDHAHRVHWALVGGGGLECKRCIELLLVVECDHVIICILHCAMAFGCKVVVFIMKAPENLSRS